MSESSGQDLAGRHWGLVIGGFVGVGLAVVVGVATDDYLYAASMLATLAVLVPVLAVLQRNHRRRRADAALIGAFGGTCNVYFENLKEIPEFRMLLGEFRMPWWARLPSTLSRLERSVMGGAVRIDRGGIVWTPSPYRRQKGMPVLSVPLEDVAGVNVRPLLSIGRGGVLEVRLRSGGEWLLSMQDSDEALSQLRRLGL